MQLVCCNVVMLSYFRCWSKNPEDRPTMSAIGRALEKIVGYAQRDEDSATSAADSSKGQLGDRGSYVSNDVREIDVVRCVVNVVQRDSVSSFLIPFGVAVSRCRKTRTLWHWWFWGSLPRNLGRNRGCCQATASTRLEQGTVGRDESGNRSAAKVAPSQHCNFDGHWFEATVGFYCH